MDLALAVRRELRLVGVEYAPFGEALPLLASGRLEIDGLLGRVYPLAAFSDLLGADEARKLFLAPDPAQALGCVE